jgi:regulation of enolase protein 1 (concanavalin A-like superfamily)
MKNTTDKNLILENFTWLNEPQDFAIQDNGLEITTDDKTDFWQNTHYGSVKKNGHFLYAESLVGFEFGAKFNFVAKSI